MPRPTGTPKTGGRTKGSVNKGTIQAQEIADRLGINPFEILLNFARGDWQALGYESETVTKYGKSGESYEEKVISPDLQGSSAAKACEYLLPKRKALEHSIESSQFDTIQRTVISKKV